MNREELAEVIRKNGCMYCIAGHEPDKFHGHNGASCVLSGRAADAVLQHLASQRQEQDAELAKYRRESAEENLCTRHPKTMLVYHCAACADSKDALEARLGELVKMTARCLREAGRGDIADVVLAEPIMRAEIAPTTPTP